MTAFWPMLELSVAHLQTAVSRLPPTQALVLHQDQTGAARKNTRWQKKRKTEKTESARFRAPTQASSHLFYCHRSTRRASGLAALPPTTDATVVTRPSHSLSTASDRLPVCLARRPLPPRCSVSLLLFHWNYGSSPRPMCLVEKQRWHRCEPRLLALVNLWGKGLRDGRRSTWTWASICT